MDRDLWEGCSEKLKKDLVLRYGTLTGELKAQWTTSLISSRKELKSLNLQESDMQITELETLDYPPLTEDLKKPKPILINMAWP